MSGYNVQAVGRRLKALREASGYSLGRLAERVEKAGFPISDKALSQWERGERTYANPDLFAALAAVYRWPDWELMLESKDLKPPAGTAPDLATAIDYPDLVQQLRQEVAALGRAQRSVRLYEWGAAGDPRDGEVRAVGWQSVPAHLWDRLGQRAFALRVEGDSMSGYGERGILNGAIVFGDPDGGRNIGDPVVASVDNKGLIVKQLWRNEWGVEVLRSVPRDGAPCLVPGSEYRVIGKVVFWINIHDPEHDGPKKGSR